jgi:hypothetical protein
MKKNNIELFNKFIEDLLLRLYENFPIEKNICITDFEYLDNKESSSIFFSSVKFLKKEEFLNYNEAVYGAYTQVVLTTKSLSLLNAIPASIEAKQTVGKELEVAVKEGKSELIKKITGEILKTAIGLFN